MDQANTLRLLMRERETAPDTFSARAFLEHASHVVSFLSVDRTNRTSELVSGLSDMLAELGDRVQVIDVDGQRHPEGRSDFILLSSESPNARFHTQDIRNVVVLTPDSVRRTMLALRAMKNDCAIDQAEVVVNSVTDPAIARRVFFDLSSDAKARFGMNLQFLGHCNRRTLLDWNEHAMKACLRLIAKRLRGERGEIA
jgi:hypothetical protein